MDAIMTFGVAIVLLLLMLAIARDHFESAIRPIRRAGAIGFGRGAVRAAGKGAVGLVRLIFRGRRPRIRRISSRSTNAHVR